MINKLDRKSISKDYDYTVLVGVPGVCPGLLMAKPDSNFVYYVTKKGDGINCGDVSE
jgi:hypothetical protein